MIQWHTVAKRVETLAFSPDGRLLASAGRRATRVQLWRPDGTPAGRVVIGWPVGAVAFSPDGRHLAVCGAPTELLLFDTTTRRRATSLYTYGPAVTAAFPPDGSAVLVLAFQELLCWDMSSRGARGVSIPSRKFDADAADLASAQGLAFGPDGRRLVATCDTAVLVWEWPHEGLARRMGHPPAGVVRSHVAVSPDGRRVAASHGRDISVWSLDADDPPLMLSGSKKSRSVRGLAFTPDGGLLAVGSDGLARLWDADAGTERQAWDFGLKNLQSLAVSPDGLTAAAGSHDGRIAVWDL